MEENGFQLKNVTLREYQKQNVDFALMKKNSISSLDIGMGKTLASIATFLEIKKNKNDAKCLVICPSSLKYHWAEEIKNCTNLKFLISEGNFNKRQNIYNDFLNKDFDVLIVNYELLRVTSNKSTKDFDVLKDIKYDMIICDEVTYIKNIKSQQNKGITKLKADFKLGLTGMPLENSPLDVFGIMKFINPMVFPQLTVFKNDYFIIQRESLGNPNNPWRVFNKVVGYKNLDDLKNKLSPWMFRKEKSEIINELPELIEKNYFVDMTLEQRRYYEELKNDILNGINPLAKMTYLREVCMSPKLLNISEDFGNKIYELLNILSNINIKENKVIIFSHFVKFINSVAYGELSNKGYNVVVVTGEDKSEEKFNKIRDFNEGRYDILLSSDTLNYGVNLQSAHVIINMDLLWNVSRMEQRTGRVYRLKQLSDNVVVINIITRNSVEERVLEILKNKSDLISKVIGLDTGNPTVLHDTEFLKSIL